MNLDLLVNSLSWLMLTVGGIFVLIGGIGALRMPDLYTRMHAASLTDGIAPMLIIGGLIPQAGFTLASFKLVAILLFILLTGPTATNALASAAMLAERSAGKRAAGEEGGRE